MSSSPTTLMGVGIPDKAANALGNTLATIAGVGTSQTAAANLTVNTVLLTTAGGATAFKFPTTWQVGDEVTAFNTSATTALIFPQSGGSIDGGSTDASVTIAQNQSRTFIKASATSWRSTASSTSTSFASLTATDATITNLTATALVTMPTIPSATVAATGTNQATAAAIATGFTLVSAGDGTKGVVLPTAGAGKVAIVKNGAAAILKVYPAGSGVINALAASAALSMASNTSAMFVCYDATTWYTIPLLPS